jgi:DNA-binding transcriptional LysR family regulator
VLIKHLEYLTALAREKHFARAAAACDVTQPTLSAGIKQLEDNLGVLIVERGQRFQGLTPEGERVLVWAQRILADVAALEQDVSETRGSLVGRLRMGVVPAALPMVTLLTTPFGERYPHTTITVISSTSVDIQRGLADFTLDVGLTYLDNEPLAHVRSVPLYRERYVLLTPIDGPMADRETVTWREAAELPLCLLTPDNQGRRIVDANFRAGGATARPRIESNSIVALCAHPRFGRFSSVLPEALVTALGAPTGVRAIPLVEPVASQSVGLIVGDHDPPMPIAAAVLRIAQEVDAESVVTGAGRVTQQ